MGWNDHIETNEMMEDFNDAFNGYVRDIANIQYPATHGLNGGTRMFKCYCGCHKDPDTLACGSCLKVIVKKTVKNAIQKDTTGHISKSKRKKVHR